MREKLLFIIIILFVFTIVANAQKFRVRNIYYEVIDSSSVKVVPEYEETPYWFTPLRGDITIPKTVTVDTKTYNVTAIGDYAFYDNYITLVIIPNSITSIGKLAFAGCLQLNSTTIPNSVTSIGYGAFFGCFGFKTITIPNSVTYIGNYAFCNCKNVKSITLPDSITSISDNVFTDCKSLEYITIPISVKSIGEGVFNNCRNLKYLNIPSSVTSIGDVAFAGCIELDSVTIPSSVKSIGEKAFWLCKKLQKITSKIADPYKVTLGNNVFKGVPIEECKLIVPKGKKQKYEYSLQWGNFTHIEEGNFVSLGGYNKLITDFKLKQNYPNPFNPQTKIVYALPERIKINLVVYDIMGKEIKRLYTGEQTSGLHEIYWDGTNNNKEKVSSGIYIYRLQSEEKIITKKMILLK